MPIIIHPAVIYNCSKDVRIIFYFQLKREKGVKRENMSVTCKDLIEYVMEQQKVKQTYFFLKKGCDLSFNYYTCVHIPSGGLSGWWSKR